MIFGRAENVKKTYFFVTTEHDLASYLLDIGLDGLGLVLILQAKCLVFNDLLFLLVNSLSRRSFLFLFTWFGGHSFSKSPLNDSIIYQIINI